LEAGRAYLLTLPQLICIAREDVGTPIVPFIIKVNKNSSQWAGRDNRRKYTAEYCIPPYKLPNGI
jgi:hypothetical protein